MGDLVFLCFPIGFTHVRPCCTQHVCMYHTKYNIYVGFVCARFHFAVHLKLLFSQGFPTFSRVLVSSPRGYPCPPPRAAGNERCAHGETLVLPRFSNGFVGISPPGTRRGGTRARGHAFVVHLKMLFFLTFSTVFEVTVSSSRPAPGGALVRPCDFACFYNVFARFRAGPRRLPQRMHFAV